MSFKEWFNKQSLYNKVGVVISFIFMSCAGVAIIILNVFGG